MQKLFILDGFCPFMQKDFGISRKIFIQVDFSAFMQDFIDLSCSVLFVDAF